MSESHVAARRPPNLANSVADDPGRAVDDTGRDTLVTVEKEA